jgi:cyclopropane-fatty-acyl-phospholipid synthase
MLMAQAMREIVGEQVPVSFTAYDGSSSTHPNAVGTLEVRSPIALSQFASAPGELGLVRAYASGYLEIVGDIYATFKAFDQVSFASVPKRLRWQIMRKLAIARAWWPVSPPPFESRKRRGRLHSEGRDGAAIQHHYDVSNAFYRLVLGPSMAYTCAVYPDAAATLEDAQTAKFDLVARKLGLQPGMKLLDVGCGWGGMAIHAAKNYGVKVIGVTLSREQAAWAQKSVVEAGLQDSVEIRHQDYRDVTETGFDAVSSIGLTEHIGQAQLPQYFKFLYDKLVPGGRLLNHCITRPHGGIEAAAGPFIDRYIFPDGELESPGELVTEIHDAGFEVRHLENLREHYALTLADWSANLEANYEAAVQESGAPIARIWRLYLGTCRYGFEANVVQLHQILAVKLDDHDNARMPLRPNW